MDLSNIQTKFQDHMTRKESAVDEDFSALLQSGKIPLDERLRVYRDNIIGGLAIVLRDTYEGVTALTGEEFTIAMLQQYIRQNLPTSGCLDEYGHDLPEFIEEFAPARSVPYLSDVARLDWALSACEHADDDVPLEPEDLAEIDINDDTKLFLRTSTYLISSSYPIFSIRNFALDPENETKEPPSLEAGEEYVLVYRPYLKAETVQLTKNEFDFLQQLQSEKPLNQALEAHIKEYQAFDFEYFLQKFLSLETFRK